MSQNHRKTSGFSRFLDPPGGAKKRKKNASKTALPATFSIGFRVRLQLIQTIIKRHKPTVNTKFFLFLDPPGRAKSVKKRIQARSGSTLL